MVTIREDNDGFEIVRGNAQVLVTNAKGALVAGTMQLLTKSGVFEHPLPGKQASGNGWTGKIVALPEITLPGVIDPMVWIKPKRVVSVMERECLQLKIDKAGKATATLPNTLKPMWEATGVAANHGYSLRPTLLIKDCFEAKFLASTPGSLPDREDEGSLVVFPGGNDLDRYGVLVDVDSDTKKGFAIKLSALVTPDMLALLK